MAASTFARPRTNRTTETALPARRRFTVDEYYRLAKAGVLRPDERVELLEGEVIRMAPIGTRHSAIVDHLARHFIGGLSDRAIVRIQGAVRLDSHSLPEPDVALLLPDPDQYYLSHPGPGDILLLVEVSDTTVRFDRNIKVPLYARTGVREIWIVDVGRKRVYVYSDLNDGVYGTVTTREAVDSLAPAVFPDLVLSLAQLFRPGR